MLLLFFTVAPGPVTNLASRSMRVDSLNEVVVSLQWVPPSPRNGPYELQLSYTAEQTPPYPAERAKDESDMVTLAQDTSQFSIREALPFAVYSVTVRAINKKLQVYGNEESITVRSEPTGELAVYDLE